MKRSLVSLGLLVLLCSAFAVAQEQGRLVVTVQTAAGSAVPTGRVAGAKVMVVHWTSSQLHAQMVQNAVATTNQMGMCTIELPPGTYDIFVSGSGLTPGAFRRDVEASGSTPLIVNLRPAPMHLRPTQ